MKQLLLAVVGGVQQQLSGGLLRASALLFRTRASLDQNAKVTGIRASKMRTSSIIALAAVGIVPFAGAEATPIIFTYTGAVQTFVVPVTGIYQIVAYGAEGGTFKDGPPRCG